MHCYHGKVVIIEPCSAQLGVLKVEAQGLDQVEFGAGDGSEADGVTRIAGNFWAMEKYAEHAPYLRALSTRAMHRC